MTVDAVKEGSYLSPTTSAHFPRIQIPTIAASLDGSTRARYPDLAQGGHTFKKAKVETGGKPGQGGPFGG